MADRYNANAVVVEIGRSASITTTQGDTYDLIIIGDAATVMRNEKETSTHHIPGFADWMRKPPERLLAVGWGVFPDGDEVIYLYDKSSGNFGYGININYDYNSEWGYAPFDVDPLIPQREEDND